MKMVKKEDFKERDFFTAWW